MNLILFGAPGSGKGTQSTFLVEKLDMRHISTGDLFRYAIKNETELGKKAKSFMDAGALVPDGVVIEMVGEALGQLENQNFILDGFPRTKPQAEALDGLLKQNGMKIGAVISLEVPEKLLMGRLTGRRVCKNCGAVYHIESKPSKENGVCDLCGGDVIQRNDDKDDVIANRLDTYLKSTQPVKDYYRNHGLLKEVDGTGDVEVVFGRIQELISG